MNRRGLVAVPFAATMVSLLEFNQVLASRAGLGRAGSLRGDMQQPGVDEFTGIVEYQMGLVTLAMGKLTQSVSDLNDGSASWGDEDWEAEFLASSGVLELIREVSRDIAPPALFQASWGEVMDGLDSGATFARETRAALLDNDLQGFISAKSYISDMEDHFNRAGALLS